MNQKQRILGVCLLFIFLLTTCNSESGGNQGFYYSPKHLGNSKDLQALLPNLKASAQPTKYTDGQNVYSITNITTTLSLNLAKQMAEIKQLSEIHIFGGTLEFLCNFNWTTNSSGKIQVGYGYASVFSDSISYAKQFAYNSANFLIFKLVSKVTPTVAISKNFQVKRIQPYTPDHLKVINHLLNDDTSTAPSAIKTQLAKSINTNFARQLQDVLNHQIFGENFNYSYYDPSYGYRQMQLIHQMGPHSIDPNNGVTITFNTKIANFNSSQCSVTVPLTPYNRTVYGGHQTVHSLCFYETVAKYMHNKGWLNSNLGSNWQSRYFQFYAGDLYDIIPSLIDKVPPKSILYGQCSPGSSVKLEAYSQSVFQNDLSLKTNYSCFLYTYISGVSKNMTIFDFQGSFIIEPSSMQTTLQFKIANMLINNLQFRKIDQFPIAQLQLAIFKIKKVSQKLIGSNVFGTGFPALDRLIPKVKIIDKAQVLYYDEAMLEKSDSTS